MKILFVCSLLNLLTTAFFNVCQAQEVVVTGPKTDESLIFSEGMNELYKSLVYKSSLNLKLHIFDDGLVFNYSQGTDPYLAPDKSYFFANFSVSGSAEGGDSPAIEYEDFMCVFVRMSDGCVVRVDTGGVCGGKWSTGNEWMGIDGSNIGKLDDHPPAVRKIFRDYSSNMRASSAGSPPKIMKYLLEGTAFDNLLACDPVSRRNRVIYKKMFILLRGDRDFINAGKVNEAIKTYDESERDSKH
jgi:hypothetical protein